MKQNKLFAAFMALLATATSVSAEEASEMNNYSFDDVVVSATGTQRRMVDSPAPIAVITAKELSNSNVTTLDEALIKLSPSFATHTSGMGTTLTFNGLEENYYIFLENGRRMEGDDPFTRIDLSRVKRIEVLSGASAALYGTNAIGGVINIITDRNDETLLVNSSTRIGSEGRLSEAVSVDFTVGNLSSATSYNYQKANNYQLSKWEEDDDELVESDHVASVAFDRHNVAQELAYAVNDRLSISANGGYYNYRTDRPYDAENEKRWSYSYNLLHENYNYGAGATYKLNDKSTIVANYYGENYTSSYDYFKGSKSIEVGELIEQKNVRYNNVNARGVIELLEGNTLTAGAEYTIDALRDDEVDRDAYTAAIFAQDEFTLVKNLTGVVGLRYTYHKEFAGRATPNASLMYVLGKINFRATYAAGFRTPTLTELYAAEYVSTKYDRVSYSNKDLKPETSNYTSVSAEYNNKWLSLSATGFYNKIQNMIEYANIGTEMRDEKGEMVEYEAQRLSNINHVEVWGLNIAANARLGCGFTVGASYSGLDPKNLDEDEPIDKSVRNVITANAAWTHSWGLYNLNVNVNGRINGERYYAYDESYAPKYQLWDLNTRHSFEFKHLFLEPGVGIENIFNFVDDRPYCSNYATLSPGRSVYASLNIRLKY